MSTPRVGLMILGIMFIAYIGLRNIGVSEGAVLRRAIQVREQVVALGESLKERTVTWFEQDEPRPVAHLDQRNVGAGSGRW